MRQVYIQPHHTGPLLVQRQRQYAVHGFGGAEQTPRQMRFDFVYTHSRVVRRFECILVNVFKAAEVGADLKSALQQTAHPVHDAVPQCSDDICNAVARIGCAAPPNHPR